MFDDMGGMTGTISSAFISLSAEYPDILSGVLFLFAAIGVVISATAVFDIIKLGKSDSQMGSSNGGAITGKLIGGVGLVDLSFWARTWAGTLWANENPLGINEYAASGSGDYANQAMMAALGIIVIGGYVVLGRAYLGITKLGYLTPESRSNMIGNIVSRVFAGSAMVSAMHIARLIGNSTNLSIVPV